jgi:antitoxin CptB|tara:strand:+ start:394 stop:651 length:258 start_codon:yes stop_codon:yes gene_type:complete
MNQEINRILWKCRRGMREIDLLLREFSQNKLNELNKSDIDIFNEILNYDDQRLYDFIFKKEPLDNRMHEKFIETNLKKFNDQGNF